MSLVTTQLLFVNSFVDAVLRISHQSSCSNAKEISMNLLFLSKENFSSKKNLSSNPTATGNTLNNPFQCLQISILNLEQPKRSLVRKVAGLMLFSTNPTFEMEKLKKPASEVHQNLDIYTYGEFLLAVGSRKDSQSYVCQVQRAQ